MYLQLQAAGRDPSWATLLVIQLLRWWPWALVTVPLQRVARGWRPQRVGWWRSGAVLTSLAAILLPLHVAWGLFVDLGLFQGIWLDSATWARRIGSGSLVALPVFALAFGGILAFTYIRDFRAEYQRRQIDAERLRSDLAEARLQALQLQLQPHFLFNSLHTIASLMEEDVARAKAMTARLGALLRATLEVSDAPEVPLADEIDLARLYLAIEEVRFEDRLRVEWAIDPALLDERVPTLTLQPLVENAIRHGVGARPDAGALRIEATREAQHMRIAVSDDGTGPPENPAFGTGLASVASRLEQQFGDSATLRLSRNDAGGCTATVTLPLST